MSLLMGFLYYGHEKSLSIPDVSGLLFMLGALIPYLVVVETVTKCKFYSVLDELVFFRF